MSQTPPQDKISLEDLLRLKRAERPPAEFWTGFERDLHARRLAALVEKKRWWHAAPRLLARFSYLPIGATAALALAFVAVREYRPPAAESVRPVGNGFSESPATARPVAALPAPVNVMPAQLPSVGGTAPAEEKPGAPAATQSDLSSWPSLPASNPALAAIARMGSEPIVASTRLTDAGLVLSRSAELPLDARFDGGGFRIHPAVVDPLTQVTPPAETRRTRLLAALLETHYAASTESPAVARTRDRLASRLDDGDFSDDISRLGVEGTRVSFKF